MANNNSGLKLSQSTKLRNTLRTIILLTTGAGITLAALALLGALKLDKDPQIQASLQFPQEQQMEAEKTEMKTSPMIKSIAEASPVAEKAEAMDENEDVASEDAPVRGEDRSQDKFIAGGTKSLGSSVAFSAVNASLGAEAGMITWSTSTETNSSLFLVERSTNGKNFDPIGLKIARGDSYTLKEYSFEDKKIKGAAMPVVFYRVRHVGMDGVSHYSKVIDMDLPAKLGLYTKVERIETDEQIHLQYAADERRMITLKITNEEGKVLMEKELAATPIAKTLELNISRWKRGNYFVHLFDNRGSATESFEVK